MQRNHKLISTLSLILAIAMVICMAPSEGIAEAVGADFNGKIYEGEGENAPPETSVEDAEIAGEIASGRGEYQKEYQLSNGQRLMVMYPESVHYEEDGAWKEIDNTLKIEEKLTGSTYRNTAGLWEVRLPENISGSSGIEVKKDGNSLEFRFAGELMARPGEEVMGGEETAEAAEEAPVEEIAEEITAEAEEAVEEPTEIAEAEEEPEEEPAEPEIEIENPVSEEAGVVTVNGEVYGTTQARLSVGAVQEQTNAYAEAGGIQAATAQPKLSSAIEYSGVYTETDVRYDLRSNRLKESVIINSRRESLRGYRYEVETSLRLEQQTDGSINAYKDGAEEPVFVMPAPYLVDGKYEHSEDITVVLEETETGYILSYILPREWLNAEEREYPVVLDPVIQPVLSTANIQDQTVFEKKTEPYTWGMVETGRYSKYGISRFFVKYKDLPALTSADVITGASMSLYKLENVSETAQVNVHKVNGTWESSTITWSNKPGYNSTIEDYQIIDKIGWFTWDVTDIVRGWYSGANTGMMFKSSDAIENGSADNWKQFCSCDFAEGTLPTLYITYINNNGIEGYWDYAGQSAGRAGAGYVNEYTGNLVWVHDDLGFTGNRMPVSIKHVYNANDKGNNGYGMGYGWRTNYNQTVYQWSVNSSYYVWEDEDGTRHYFKSSGSGTYKDETDNGLVLTTTGSGTTKYSITDKNGNKSCFDTNGRLTKISNNQATKSSIDITYTTGSGKLISQIEDGAGRVYAFTYANNLLTKIAFKGAGTSEITSLRYEYSGGNLTKVIYPDNKQSTYEYNGTRLLTKAVDVDGYNIRYGYNTTSSSQPNRVTSIAEYDGSTGAGTLTLEYAHNQTTLTDHNGNREIMQFNNWGNTVSVQDGQGRAQFAEYAKDTNQTSGKANQLTRSSKLQNTVVNLIRNSGFETNDYWTPATGNGSDGTTGYATAQKYMGEKSLYITRTTNSGEYKVQAASNSYITLTPGKTYTFSAYVKTTGMSGTGTGAGIAIGLNGGGVVSASETIKENSDWTRIETTYTHPAGSTNNTAIPYLVNSSVGTAYFDCVQLEESPNASRYNLIDNGDFRYAGSVSTDAYGWLEGDGCRSMDSRITVSGTAAPQLDGSVYSVTGDAERVKRCYQNIITSGSAGDVYTVAGWAKGDSIPLRESESLGRRFGIVVQFYNTDGTEDETLLKFNTDADSSINWQYGAKRAVAKKNYSSIRVLLVYEKNANVVYFDGIQLFKEEFGHSYVYDADGNVTSVTDLQKKTTTYEYANNNLTKMTLPTGAKQTYTYDSYHNVTSATSPEGVVSNFTYDTYGNNTKVTVGGGTQKLQATATYTSNGNMLSSVTDALGNTTSYGYDAQTGVLNWVQAPGETAETRTNYTYDNLYRTTQVEKDGTSNSYTYTDDLLAGITSASDTAYTFTYGVFDQIASVKAGDRTLISHTYTNDANRRLSKSEYGNGDYITYAYDSYGRITQTGYEDNANALEYVYDNNGNLGLQKDNIAERTTKYYYDMQDRLMRYDVSGSGYSSSIQWGYDDLNNLTTQTHTLNGTTYTESYSYDDDNRLTGITNGDVSSTYSYDLYSRMNTLAAKYNNTNVVTTSIGYKNPSGTTTSSQVATWQTQTPNYNKTYTYTYDSRGNITAITDGTNTTTYEYDGLDQLTRENNQAANKTWTYSYDNGGNILEKKEYAYNTGTLGTAQKTTAYEYGDNSWKDVLTKYANKTVTSDAIGNITNSGTYKYTWQHGRQLVKTVKGLSTYSYTYDADGRRLTQTAPWIGKISYYYTGSELTKLIVQSHTLTFTYDNLGVESVDYDGTMYYYLRNAQGDITGIVDTSGNVVTEYVYDAWGNVISTTGSKSTTVGKYSPFRYRGYIYDDSGLYYLKTRYYDPAMGRFVCADGYASTGVGLLGTNSFAYCNNNPSTLKDSGGTRPVDCVRLTEEAHKKESIEATKKERQLQNEVSRRSKVYDISKRLDEAMVENAQIISDIKSNFGNTVAAAYFAYQVAPGGTWDFKSQSDWNLVSDGIYIYHDKILRFDDIGNIHYGYVGSVLFREWVLLAAGGVVQIGTHTSKWSYWTSFFDDPHDQEMISYGCELWRHSTK